jgi:hypothetical protein
MSVESYINGEGSPRSNGFEISTEEFIAIEETTAINLDISELIKNKRQSTSK